jgi:hypothetical protein
MPTGMLGNLGARGKSPFELNNKLAQTQQRLESDRRESVAMPLGLTNKITKR